MKSCGLTIQIILPAKRFICLIDFGVLKQDRMKDGMGHGYSFQPRLNIRALW